MRHLLPAALALTAALPAAHAGDFDATLRPFQFRWHEDIAGHDPIRERGTLVAAALTYRQALSASWQGEGSVELWGGSADYDGYGVDGWVPLHTTTTYLGTRAEATLRWLAPAAGGVSLQPFAALGHRAWRRSRSDETWTSVFGRLGARAEMPVGAAVGHIEAGALLPMHTRVQVDWSGAGYGRFSLAPRNRSSAFASVGARLDRLSIALTYEAQRFGRSPQVAVARTSGISGAVIENSQAYQPESKSSTVGLSLQYRF